jgi:hypothetical protein
MGCDKARVKKLSRAADHALASLSAEATPGPIGDAFAHVASAAKHLAIPAANGASGFSPFVAAAILHLQGAIESLNGIEIVGAADGVEFIEDGETPTPEPDFIEEDNDKSEAA